MHKYHDIHELPLSLMLAQALEGGPSRDGSCPRMPLGSVHLAIHPPAGHVATASGTFLVCQLFRWLGGDPGPLLAPAPVPRAIEPEHVVEVVPEPPRVEELPACPPAGVDPEPNHELARPTPACPHRQWLQQLLLEAGPELEVALVVSFGGPWILRLVGVLGRCCLWGMARRRPLSPVRRRVG